MSPASRAPCPAARSWRGCATRCLPRAARRMDSTCTTPAAPPAAPRPWCSATVSWCTTRSAPSAVRLPGPTAYTASPPAAGRVQAGAAGQPLQHGAAAHQPRHLPPHPAPAEMRLNRLDVWGHFAPMFHLVDVFAVYAITLVGGRHVTIPAFTPQDALLAMGECRSSTAVPGTACPVGHQPPAHLPSPAAHDCHPSVHCGRRGEGLARACTNAASAAALQSGSACQ